MRSFADLKSIVNSLEWYHTLDLGNGIITPGHYDHRPYLGYYALPEALDGKTVLDVGAASGFFSFEFERRGASVVATDLPEWFDHDFGPNYHPDKTAENGRVYLHSPFEVARDALGSTVQRKLINIYDISPETTGTFDIVFCGSVLLHLTDPIKALWNLASVTREKAIIATVIEREESERPIATMTGHQRGDVWWIPTRACLELMTVSAGFAGIEWINEFELKHRDGSPGPYHGVLHAYKTNQNWTANTLPSDEVLRRIQALSTVTVTSLKKEVDRLNALLGSYEHSRLIRLVRRIQRIYRRKS